MSLECVPLHLVLISDLESWKEFRMEISDVDRSPLKFG